MAALGGIGVLNRDTGGPAGVELPSGLAAELDAASDPGCAELGRDAGFSPPGTGRPWSEKNCEILSSEL